MSDIGVDEPPYEQLLSGERAEIIPATVSLSSNGVEEPDQRVAGSGCARINVLGPVTFEDVQDFLRPRSYEIAVYLALHPDGVSEGQLDEMIWPTKAEGSAMWRSSYVEVEEGSTKRSRDSGEGRRKKNRIGTSRGDRADMGRSNAAPLQNRANSS